MSVVPDMHVMSCPCCGGKAKAYKYLSAYYVRCNHCKLISAPYPTPEQAVAAWEQRNGTEHEYKTLLMEAEKIFHEVLPVNYETEHNMRILGKRIKEVCGIERKKTDRS